MWINTSTVLGVVEASSLAWCIWNIRPWARPGRPLNLKNRNKMNVARYLRATLLHSTAQLDLCVGVFIMSMLMNWTFSVNLFYTQSQLILVSQCLDTVDWVTGRASSLYKTDRWGAGVIVCLERVACLHMAQLMPLQVDTFPYLGSLITEDGECTTEFRTRLNKGQAIGASLQKIWKIHSIPISAKIRLMKALVWPLFILVRNSVVHSPSSVIRDPR